MTPAMVRTVLGDIEAHRLGVTNSHDHLFFSSPVLAGQELDDPDLALAEALAFTVAGGQSIVQWTPRGLRRQHDRLAQISRATGLQITSATGRHRAVHHRVAEPVDELTQRFLQDIERAVTPAGFIKVGTGFHHLDSFERASLQAAAQAHGRTGVPIAVHLELGTAGDLVLEVLSAYGVLPTSVILGHVGRNPENGYLRELAASGAFLCFDGPSRGNHQTDWRSTDCIDMLAQDGHLDQILIGGDTTTGAARFVTSGPGMPGLLDQFGPRLRQRIGREGWAAITIANPARAWVIRTPDAPGDPKANNSGSPVPI